jgi:phosphatidylglycerol lysyltransferase
MVFLPSQPELGLVAVLCAYFLALGAGLLSQSPGGLGAFELAMIMLLPQIATGQLLAAIFAYRVTYHAAPAIASIISLMRARPAATPALLLPATGKTAARAFQRSAQAEWGLIHQGATILLNRDQSAGWLTRKTSIALTTIGRPLGPPHLTGLTQSAQASGHIPLLYKCPARTAATARRAGWSVVPIAQEAVISPAAWSADGPQKRQLRRKLRTATKAGLRIDARPGRLPWDAMRQVSDAWQQTHGTERGFSMGRFAPELVVRQLAILAYVDSNLVGFVTFHRTPDEWGLDLMRFSPAAPSGTMQALIAAALAMARERQVARVSLAACTLPALTLPKGLWSDSARQFKHSFGPKWRPLYAAAPSRSALVAALASAAFAIHWPTPLPQPPRERRRWVRGPKFRFELSGPTCDAQSRETQPAAAGPTPPQALPRNRSDDQRPHRSP